MHAVICFKCENYSGPTHLDTSIHHLGFREDIGTPKELDTGFETLAQNDISGSIMPLSYNHESVPPSMLT